MIIITIIIMIIIIIIIITTSPFSFSSTLINLAKYFVHLFLGSSFLLNILASPIIIFLSLSLCSYKFPSPFSSFPSKLLYIFSSTLPLPGPQAITNIHNFQHNSTHTSINESSFHWFHYTLLAALPGSPTMPLLSLLFFYQHLVFFQSYLQIQIHPSILCIFRSNLRYPAFFIQTFCQCLSL